MQNEATAVKHDAKRRALGKGLEALLPPRPTTIPAMRAEALPPARLPEFKDVVSAEGSGSSVPAAAGMPLEIQMDLIDRNPFQTRTHFDQEKLQELARSIEANGVVQPIVVRKAIEGRYQLVTGERRYLASQEAGKTHIPAVVRQLSDEQAMEMTIVENLQRENLNPMEQARAYARLSREFNMTQEAMAARTGLSRAAVSNFLRLLRLPEEVQARVEAGELSFGHAKILLGLDPEAIPAAAQKVVALSMSVRQTETYVQRLLNPERKTEPEARDVQQDPNVRAMQDTLQQSLGLRVTIEDRAGRGKVIIEYGGVDDFEAILAKLGAK